MQLMYSNVLSVMAFSTLLGHLSAQRHTTGALVSSLASLVSKNGNLRPTRTTNATAARLRRRSFQSSASLLTNNTIPEPTFDFDYFVIGAGSGGIASARRASSYGAKVAVAEAGRLGGTCVNVGCVPKKVMWNAASIAETIHDMKHYGFSTGGKDDDGDVSFDWQQLKVARDAYIQRLNAIYQRNLENSGIQQPSGTAELVDLNTVQVSSDAQGVQTFTAEHILIAVGGKPTFPPGEGIEEYAISSDGFFEIETLPRRAVVVGAGYIAVEIAGVLQALGTETFLVVRKECALRNFDDMVRDTLDAEMQRQGIQIVRDTNGVDRIEETGGLKTVYLKNGQVIEDIDMVLMAPGREPNVDGLNLAEVGVEQRDGGYIVVNEYSETTAPNIYAVGDVIGMTELTPVAIAAGRRLADRLFGGMSDAKVSYDLVPSVVFSHPAIGTIGLTEQEATEKYGKKNVSVYKAKFTNLYYGPWNVEAEDKPKTAMKLVCAGEDELVVGLHVIGIGADEMLQGFGIALKMGATKADFDSCMAIHPTAAEEFVTMFPWGMSKQISGAKESPLNGADPPEPSD